MDDGATLLRGFLDRNDVTQRAASVALGVSDPTVHDWLKRTKRPVAHHRTVIAVWTRGEVPVESWLREHERGAMANARPHEPADESGEHAAVETLRTTG